MYFQAISNCTRLNAIKGSYCLCHIPGYLPNGYEYDYG